MDRRHVTLLALLAVLLAGCTMEAPEVDVEDPDAEEPNVTDEGPSEPPDDGDADGDATGDDAAADGKGPGPEPVAFPAEVTVRAVVAADELAVTYANGTNDTVALLGVDVPAADGSSDPADFSPIPDSVGGRNCLAAWGARADGFVRRVLPATVTVHRDRNATGRDGDGRLRAEVRYGDTWLNHELVADGYARAVDGSHRNASAYAEAARAARADNDRLWNCRNPPEKYRELDGGGTGMERGGEVRDAECSDYQTQSAAQEAYEDGLTDLDADGDGIACEGIGG